MQADNLVKAPGTTTHRTRRKPRARMALTRERPADRRMHGPVWSARQRTSRNAPGMPGSSSQARCSNRTLRGSYAFNIDGTIIAGPNRLLLRGLAMTTVRWARKSEPGGFHDDQRCASRDGLEIRLGHRTSSIRTAPERWRSSRVMGARRSGSGWSSPITAGRSTTSSRGIRPALRDQGRLDEGHPHRAGDGRAGTSHARPSFPTFARLAWDPTAQRRLPPTERA